LIILIVDSSIVAGKEKLMFCFNEQQKTFLYMRKCLRKRKKTKHTHSNDGNIERKEILFSKMEIWNLVARC